MRRLQRLTALTTFEVKKFSDLTADSVIVDVSSNNGTESRGNLIDWELASETVDYAIIRSTMGAKGFDESFAYNIVVAQRYGVGTGAYHFFRPDSDGTAQAQHFLNVTQPYSLDFFAVDVEPPSDGVTIAPNLYAKALYEFVMEFKRVKGFYPTIYTNFESWRTLVGTDYDATFKLCPLWVANYVNNPNITQPLLPRSWDTYLLWQYTSQGKVAGISKTWNGTAWVWGNVDLNRIKVKESNVDVPLSKFVIPTDLPFTMTQRYGANPDYYKQFGLMGHEGTDGYGSTDRIYSIGDGTVKLVFKDDNAHPYGNHIRITHEGGYESIYAHLRGFKAGLVKGSTVEAGELIGFMGNTGNVIKKNGSQGIHLHLSVKLNGKVIDPETVIPFG